MPSRRTRHLLFLPLLASSLFPFAALAWTPVSRVVFLGSPPVTVSTLPVADSDEYRNHDGYYYGAPFNLTRDRCYNRRQSWLLPFDRAFTYRGEPLGFTVGYNPYP